MHHSAATSRLAKLAPDGVHDVDDAPGAGRHEPIERVESTNPHRGVLVGVGQHADQQLGELLGVPGGGGADVPQALNALNHLLGDLDHQPGEQSRPALLLVVRLGSDFDVGWVLLGARIAGKASL
jgi:hypothetical protein